LGKQATGQYSHMNPRILFLVSVLLAGCEAAPPPPDGAEVAESPLPEEEPRSEGEVTGCEDLSAADAGPAQVIMQDFEFVHPCFAVSSTQGLQLVNSGSATHNFSIGELLDVDVEPGAQVNTEPLEEILAPGEYDFVCKYHEDRGMIGQITVE
jgi:plastocyanin